MATVEIRTPGIGRRTTLLAVACLVLGALAGGVLGRAFDQVDEVSTAAPSHAVAGAQPADIDAVRQQNYILRTVSPTADIEAVRQQQLSLPIKSSAPVSSDIEAVRQHNFLEASYTVPDIEAVRQQNLSASAVSR